MIINKTFIKYILHILLKYAIIQDQYVPVVWLLSCVQLFVTPRTPLVLHHLPEFAQMHAIESVMLSNHLILWWDPDPNDAY